MKSQVITPRISNRDALGKGRSSGMVQRPSRRDRGSSAWSQRGPWGARSLIIIRSAKIISAISIILLGVLVYRTAASAAFFQARNVDVSGAGAPSSEEIRTVVHQFLLHTGVWRADLPGLSSEIVNRVPWVRSAVVSRVLPDGLRVRITERVPRAVLRTTEGHLVWVDDDAVILRPMSPADRVPSFFIHGLDESKSESARTENRERMKKYIEVARDWDAGGVSQRVSEINLSDLRDVRVQLSGHDAQIEVRLGGEDTASRFKRAVKVLDSQRDTPCGAFIRYIVVTQTNTTIGLPQGMQPCAANGALKGTADQSETAKAEPAAKAGGKSASRAAGVKPKVKPKH